VRVSEERPNREWTRRSERQLELAQGLSVLVKEVSHVFTVSDPITIAIRRDRDRPDTRLKRMWSEHET